MADEKKNEEKEKESGGSKLGILENKAVMLGGIVIVQVILAIALTQFLILPKLGVQGAQMAPETLEKSEKKELADLGVLVGLEEIIVTLKSDSGKPRYLRININLEVKNQMAAEVVTTRLPQLRDIVIMALSDKTVDDLSRPEGKKGLRDEIFRRIDEKMPDDILMNVYFSDLVVQ